MKSKKKVIIFGLVILLLAVAIPGAVYLRKVSDYRNAIDNITYSGVNISEVPDGIYIGECDVDFIYAKVEVTVINGQIAEIKLLEHDNDRGDAATGIEQVIVEQQQVDVNAVSGATNSSKVIKKAVDNALVNAV